MHLAPHSPPPQRHPSTSRRHRLCPVRTHERPSQPSTHTANQPSGGQQRPSQTRKPTSGLSNQLAAVSQQPRSRRAEDAPTRGSMGRSTSGGGSTRGVPLPSDMLAFRFSSRDAQARGCMYRPLRAPHTSTQPPTRPPRRRSQHRPAPYDKNKFLQANFRFVVSDAIDLPTYRRDADLMLKWDDVVQVQMLTTSDIQCPITLEAPPTCAQITPCGHVFTFHGIMQHFLHHGGPQLVSAAPCPLCGQRIAARELRMVHIVRVEPVRVDQPITLQLLRRPRDCILAEPVNPPKGQGDAPFAKFRTTSDPSSLWRATAQQLADLAVQVCIGP